MQALAGLSHPEIERRKDRVRRAWAYQPVDHLPIGFFLDDYGGHTLREVCEHGELQFEMALRTIDRLLRVLPDDYIPAARVWPGYMTIATMFGLQVHWSDDPNQAPGVAAPLIHDMAQVRALQKPDVTRAGLMPFNLRWLAYFREHLPPDVSLTGIDLGGPLNTAKDLFETNLLYTAFYDTPEVMHQFLDLATAVQMDCYREIVQAAGGLDRLTSIDFTPFWTPEGRKGFVADDVCAALSPAVFQEFSRPYNSRIFQLWPGGLIHNCGPHPSLELYLDHNPPIGGINCSYRCTRKDLPRIREAFRGRGVVQFMFDCGETATDIIRGYEEIANALSPYVVGLPLVWLNPTWSDDDIRHVYDGLVDVAARYARDMNWVGSSRC